MKIFALTTLLLSASTTILADFLLIDGAWTTESGKVHTLARAVNKSDQDSCDGIDNSPEPDGAVGDYSYPWPETTFTVSLCEFSLRFTKNGNDYNVYNAATSSQVGKCSKGSNLIKSCFWGFISAEYNTAYTCTGACK